MAPDAALLLALLEPVLEARGLLTSNDAQQTARALALAVAMERRAAVLAESASPAKRKRLERIRKGFRHGARVMASALGLLPADRVDAAPVDAHGHDPELAEWFAVSPDALTAKIRETLALPKMGEVFRMKGEREKP